VETPFISNLARGKATAVFEEWLTDSLADAAANRQVEGDSISGTSAGATTRLGNYNQISWKTVTVSRTQEKVQKAGSKSTVARLLAKAGKELKRDMEFTLTRNQASSAGGSATARSLASVESWLATNKTSVGPADAGKTTPGFSSGTVAAPTDGSSNGTFSEVSLKQVLQLCWTAGGEPKTVMTGAFNKTRASKFAGIATIYRETTGSKQATVVGAADVYISDFGEVRIVPNRFSRDQTVLVLDMDYWELRVLRPMETYDLSVTGSAFNKVIETEYTLVSRNEKASGKVTECLTSGTFVSG